MANRETLLPSHDFIIREARPEDAAGLIAYVNDLANEPGIYIGISPGEFNLTVDQERQILTEYAEAENSIYLSRNSQLRVLGQERLFHACQG